MAEIPRKWLTLGLRRKSPLDVFRNEIYSLDRCVQAKKMEQLIKKYSILLIIGFLLPGLLTLGLLSIQPDLLTLELPNGYRKWDDGYIKIVFGLLINLYFIFQMKKDMEKEKLKSNLILITTFFSAFIGVVFFWLAVANNKFNGIKDFTQ